ncbi:MAG: PIN domain-containing protein [Desulfomicrobium sp.]|nr:PIN domain-containing protein [Desulfomicrobium sp.]
MIDTNILISAALFPNSVPALAYMKAVIPPHIAIVCDYSIDEMRRVYTWKFPYKISDFERFLSMRTLSVKIIDTPLDKTAESEEGEKKLRDLNDHPICLATLAARADYILTGDKDFLDSGITHPKDTNSSGIYGNKIGL